MMNTTTAQRIAKLRRAFRPAHDRQALTQIELLIQSPAPRLTPSRVIYGRPLVAARPGRIETPR